MTAEPKDPLADANERLCYFIKLEKETIAMKSNKTEPVEVMLCYVSIVALRNVQTALRKKITRITELNDLVETMLADADDRMYIAGAKGDALEKRRCAAEYHVLDLFSASIDLRGQAKKK